MAAPLPHALAEAVARELHAPGGDRFFTVIFGFDLVVLADFAILVGSAIALRRRSDVHKRLMLQPDSSGNRSSADR